MTNIDSMPSEVREYFAHERRKIISVEARTDFTLMLTFDNQEKRLLDMKDILKGPVFETLRTFDNFKYVFIDSSGCIAWDKDPSIDSSIVWNNRIDLCSDSCYLKSIPLSKITPECEF